MLKSKDSIDLGTEQKIAYEVICSTFFLKLLDENKPTDKQTLDNLMKFKTRSRQRWMQN